MTKFRETYLMNLTNIVGEIMKKEKMSQQDIELLALFKSEMKNYEYVPPFKRFLGNLDMLFGFLDKKFLNNFSSDDCNKENLDTCNNQSSCKDDNEKIKKYSEKKELTNNGI